jgi:hypothetical protein
MQAGNGQFPTFEAGLLGIEVVEAAISSARDRRPMLVGIAATDFGRAYPPDE